MFLNIFLLGLTAVTLAGFWLLPGGVIDLRRLAHGRLQVDLRPAYGADTVYAMLDAYGNRGRVWFGRMLRADLVFPMLYAATIWTLAASQSATHAHPATLLAQGAGIAAAAFDELENILLLRILSVYPARHAWFARLAGAMTFAKTCGLLMAVGVLAAGIA